MPGPELIASGTDATPQLLTFGEISGTPAAGTGSSEPAASSAAVAPSASATPVVAPASSSAVAVAVSSSAVVEVVSTPAAPVSSAAAIPSSVAEPELPVEATPTPALSSAPYPVGNSTTTPTATGAPIVSSTLPSLTPPVISVGYSTASVALPSTFATVVRPQPSEDASTGSIKEYYQCGGSGFKGTAACAEGLECKEWNAWYSQCVKADATKPGPSKGPMPAEPAKPTSTKVVAAPSASAVAAAQPTKVVPVSAEPTKVAPVANEPTENEPAEKTYTLETFIAFLEENAGSASAAKIRRMIEALM